MSENRERTTNVVRWTCPGCGRENGPEMVCPGCGFDESANFLAYPTLMPLPQSAADPRRARLEAEVKRLQAEKQRRAEEQARLDAELLRLQAELQRQETAEKQPGEPENDSLEELQRRENEKRQSQKEESQREEPTRQVKAEKRAKGRNRLLAVVGAVVVVVALAVWFVGSGGSSSVYDSTTTGDSDVTVVEDSTTTGDSNVADSTATAEPEDSEATVSAMIDCRVAMITDYGDITDQSFNQTTYEVCKEYCADNELDFMYYKPDSDSDADRVAMVEKAVDEGYNVVVMPGYAFAPTIETTAEEYSDITFIALDVSSSDFSEGYELPSNVYCAVYQEELAGYMAGVAAVKLGYTHLGFLGGMAVPAVIRYGYGFVQGADAAAAELGVDVTVEYVYGNQFSGDSDITAYMDTWYQNLGVEVVFACGDSIYTSACESAAKVDGKVIGVDTDQAELIDGTYGADMTVTSAMKGLATTVKDMLDEIMAGNFAEYGGQIATLGLVSGDDVEANYVQLPTASTQWADGFTEDDYAALVADMYDGTITVSNDTTTEPEVSISVNYYGNIK